MEKIYTNLCRILEFLLVGIFSILVIDVLWQVFTRYFIGNPSSFTEELSRFLLIWLAVLSTAYSRSYKGQMAIDFIFEKLSNKNQFFLNLFIEICIVIFVLFVMVIGGINLMYITLKLGQFSPSLHFPVGIVYSVVPISGVIILFFSSYHIKNYIGNRTTISSKNKKSI